MRRNGWLSLILWIPFITACVSPVVSNTAATLSVEERVIHTLVAHAMLTTLTPQAGWGENAPGEQHSIEITPAPIDNPISNEPAQTGSMPDEYYIRNIWGHRQFFAIGCEASAVRDWAMFLGIDINEFKFQFELPISDNPDLGFVGWVEDPWGQVPPYSYGVHAAPVAEVLRSKYNIPAQATKRMSLADIKREIASGQPVIAWVVGNCVGGIPYEYIDKKGNKVTVAAYEHVVIVTGYNITHIRYMNNGKFYDIPNEYFLNSWGILGNMAVYLK